MLLQALLVFTLHILYIGRLRWREVVFEFIGIFLLNLLGRQYDTKNIGLYRDDGLLIFKNCSGSHCVKSVRIRSYSGQHFLAFGLNAERYGVSLLIQSECRKMGTRITPNTDSFYAVPQMGKIQKRLPKVF